jgi:hypothetical protein
MVKGGKREGAGRKKNTHKTKSITFHIRVEWEKDIRKLVQEFKSNVERK